MALPTYRQVEDEIAKLKEIKPNVRRYTFFGDDNWLAIEAQIDVLDNDLDEDEIYAKYENDNDALDATNAVLDSALGALRWMLGEEDESPSQGWQSLVKEPDQEDE